MKKLITIRVTEEERALLKGKAAAAGMNVADFIRASVCIDERKPKDSAAKDTTNTPTEKDV